MLEGGYADLLGYLKAMEALPQRVLWGAVSLKVEQHPTLGADPACLHLEPRPRLAGDLNMACLHHAHHAHHAHLAKAAKAALAALLLTTATVHTSAGTNAGTSVGTSAGPLADPTRPPSALAAPGGLAAAALPQRANLATARAIAAAARAAEPPPPANPAQLQAVQLPAHGAASALVDGRQIKVGDSVDGRSVLAIDGQGLLLKGPRGPERLWLLDGTPKQAVGSISQSQSARFQAAPLPGAPGAAGDTNTATPAERGQTPVAPMNTSAAPGSLSLAGRTTP